jgi:hypothetical protein
MTSYSANIDYLSVSFFNENPREKFKPVFGELTELGKGPHGFNLMERYEIGAVLLSEGPEKQGVNLTLKGQELAAYRAAVAPDEELIYQCNELGGKASRVDWAVNIHEGTVSPKDLWADHVEGRSISKARLDKRYTAHLGRHDGFYLGSDKSDRFLRVYDKAVEQNRAGEAWLRLELVTKRLVARAYFERACLYPEVQPFIRRAIQEFAQWPMLPEVVEALDNNIYEVPHFPAKKGRWWLWIEQQVIPSLVKRQMEYQHEDVVSLFWLLWRIERKKYKDAHKGDKRQVILPPHKK